jgi:transposase
MIQDKNDRGRPVLYTCLYMIDQSRISQVKHLYEVEKLTMRQIAGQLRMCTKTISSIITGKERPKKERKPSLISPYIRLIGEWYEKYPRLRATQVYERLKTYGYTGGYGLVIEQTGKFRKRSREVYHELEFLPGEAAQVDWMEAKLSFGKVYGFVYILAYSRYLFVQFYPRSSLEFFLDGHIGAYVEIGGIPRRLWYDNLKSVVIQRKPELILNAHFLDFARHYGFSIHPCTPGRANEKGRVERVIRDIRAFIEADDFADCADLNRKAVIWRKEKNLKTHRATKKMPFDALREEPLIPLPAIPYKPCRMVPASIGKTAFIEFETNRYSLPGEYAGAGAMLRVYVDRIEIFTKDRLVATHPRSFGRNEKHEHPSHREKLLQKTPNFKYERIYQLMKHMGKEIDHFLGQAEDDPLAVAYGLFRLLKTSSKEMILSAVREANSLHVYKLKYVESILTARPVEEESPVYPRNASLLNISYRKRDLTEYDELA